MNVANDIAEFLASRRAKITPERAGLPSYGTRRVPGLRREEVASLGGVSADYYRRLERGQVSGASELVLESLARALQLDEAERAHLLDLARAAGPIAPRRTRPRKQRVRPVILRLLDQIEAPAIVSNANGDLMAANALGRALYSPVFEPGAAGQQRPVHSGSQIVEAQWVARERGLERFRTEQPPYSLLTRMIELDVLPTAQRHGMGILSYSPLGGGGGWLSGGWTADSSPTSPARRRLASRFDMSLPENQRKLEAVEQLAQVAEDAGISMIELAIAFVVNHPGVTSAIIGPRTMEQLESQVPAADVVLDAATLDRIDEIVKPGVNLNPADTSYGEQVLQPALRRR